MLVEYDNARILITDQKLESIKDVMGILEAAAKGGGPLVIIAEDVTVRIGLVTHDILAQR
jgi:chaperonin GroEL